jgi:sugar phosphate isomerase/epimerase
MNGNRRQFLAAAMLPALQCLSSGADAPQRARLGVVQYSYALRLSADRAANKLGLHDPLTFLAHCHDLGAGGVQMGIGTRDKDYLIRFRKQLDACAMDLEGSIRLPRDRADEERFAAEVRSAREAGARVLRSVLLSGRRYEQFADREAYRDAVDRAEHALKRVEPIVAKHDMLLALENHKDFRADELMDLLKRLGSRYVGVCVDTGNSIALLEDPLTVVRTLAPRAFTVHLKDMAIAEYDEGFLLAEVPLGAGFLDLPKMIALLRAARPAIRFNLEMITRDPLRVPCLTDKYWATASASGRDLARTLTMARKHKHALPRVSDREPKEQIAIEEENVRKSLAYARNHLEL